MNECISPGPDLNLELLCRDLIARHHVHTILLYGSWASGDADETSDIDIAAFADVPVVMRDAHIIERRFMDVFVYPESVLEKPMEDHLRLRHSRILIQRGTEASEFLEKLRRLFDEGPGPLPEDEIAASNVWAWKMWSRMQRPGIDANFRRVWLLTALLEDYFCIRQLWYQGPKRSFRYLREFDPQTYDAFEAALKPEATTESVQLLVERCVGKRPPEL